MVESGLLEIYRYVPPVLLEGVNFADMGMDDFLEHLAKARYIQEIEAKVIQKGIADAFSTDS